MQKSAAADEFTDSLLTVIREQRHKAARIIVATQEPTISPQFLDLCLATFVHRFSSPNWFATLKSHIAGVSTASSTTRLQSEDPGQQNQSEANEPGSVAATTTTTIAPAEPKFESLMTDIAELGVGESLLFAPSAMLRVDGAGKARKMGLGHVKFKTRPRVSADGGRSILSIRN